MKKRGQKWSTIRPLVGPRFEIQSIDQVLMNSKLDVNQSLSRDEISNLEMSSNLKFEISDRTRVLLTLLDRKNFILRLYDLLMMKVIHQNKTFLFVIF